MSSQPTNAERDRRRPWLLLLLLLLLLLVAALIAFVSCGGTNAPTGPAAATPNTSPSPVVSPSPSEPCCSPSPSAAAMLTVPDVVGMEADDADMTLRDTGFTDVSFVDTDGNPAALLQSWEVSRQSVPPGSKVPASEHVVLTVEEKTNGKG